MIFVNDMNLVYSTGVSLSAVTPVRREKGPVTILPFLALSVILCRSTPDCVILLTIKLDDRA